MLFISIIPVYLHNKQIEIMTALKVKSKIKKMDTYNIDKLNTLSMKSGISLMTINFWWNCFKN